MEPSLNLGLPSQIQGMGCLGPCMARYNTAPMQIPYLPMLDKPAEEGALSGSDKKLPETMSADKTASVRGTVHQTHLDIMSLTKYSNTRLLLSVDYCAAQELMAQEQVTSTNLKTLPEMIVVANAGLKYLNYLAETWMPVSLWHGWSQKGQLDASVILHIPPVEGVIPTTIHLEAFNGVLKRKHIHCWKHAGKCLRFDLLIYLLIIQILPGIFNNRKSLEKYYLWLLKRFCS